MDSFSDFAIKLFQYFKLYFKLYSIVVFCVSIKKIRKIEIEIEIQIKIQVVIELN